LISNFFKKKNFFLFVIFFIYLLIVLRFSNFFELEHLGKGIAHKFISLIFVDETIQFITTLFSFFVSWVIISIYCDNNTIDKIIIYYFLGISFFISPIFQEYFDPLILVLIFSFFKNKFIINNKNITILTLYLIIFLITANVHTSQIN